MRSLSIFGLALLGLSACSDYNLQADASIFAEPNPPDLGTPLREDRIVQVTVPSVDVLWVVDNSCSMEEEQAAITQNFPKFVNYFVGSGLDYHIGVVSTGFTQASERGKLRSYNGQSWIDESTPNPVEAFRAMAQMGTSGPADEMGRAQVYGTLELLADTDYNRGFEREGAHLAVIVISDEDDASGNTPISRGEFINWLQTMKPAEGMVTFSSIVGPKGGCSTASEGTDYLEVTKRVGGIEWSICRSDWDQALQTLGMQAAGLKREFFLSQVPVEDSLEVWVIDDGEELTFVAGEDYTYSRSRNSITFATFVPNPLSEVFIEYEVLDAFLDPDDDAEEDEAE